MGVTPEQILKCLEQLELYSDDPLKVSRLVTELHERIYQYSVEMREMAEAINEEMVMLREQRDDLLRQLEQICREPV